MTKQEKQKIKKEWKAALKELYDNMEEWLPDGHYRIARKKIRLNEEKLGAYEADTLVLQFSEGTIRIDPVARFVIGAVGRVDMRGPSGDEVIFVRETNGWVFVKERIPPERPRLTRILFNKLVKMMLS